MLVAEELDVSPSQVRHSAWDTWNVVNSGATGGSTGIQSSAGPPLRAAAATAKQALLKLASTNLGVPVGEPDGRRTASSRAAASRSPTAQLVGGKLFNTTIGRADAEPGRRHRRSRWASTRWSARTVPRVDIPDKVTGKYTYVHNVRIPGMLHGRVVRPRGQGPFGTGAPIVSVDESSIAHIPGAQVVRQGDFLAVVAPNEYDAIQAAAQLKVTWKDEPRCCRPGQPLRKQMRDQDTAGNAKAAFTHEHAATSTPRSSRRRRRSRRPTSTTTAATR